MLTFFIFYYADDVGLAPEWLFIELYFHLNEIGWNGLINSRVYATTMQQTNREKHSQHYKTYKANRSRQIEMTHADDQQLFLSFDAIDAKQWCGQVQKKTSQDERKGPGTLRYICLPERQELILLPTYTTAFTFASLLSDRKIQLFIYSRGDQLSKTFKVNLPHCDQILKSF